MQRQAMFKLSQSPSLHTSKVMLKILQARLQQYVSQELPDVQAGFRKGRGTRVKNFQMFKLDLEKAEEQEIKLPTSAGSSRKQESSRKTSASLTMPKPLTVWITTNCGKFLERWEYQTTWPAS